MVVSRAGKKLEERLDNIEVTRMGIQCMLRVRLCVVSISRTHEILPLASQSADERERGVREREAVPLISGYPSQTSLKLLGSVFNPFRISKLILTTMIFKFYCKCEKILPEAASTKRF